MLDSIINNLPLPSNRDIMHVNGHLDYEWYNKGGVILLIHLCLAIKKILNTSINNFERILDFGCGTNRILGRLPTIHNNLYGVDIDESCIDYCKKNFNGNYFVNKIEPKLQFEDNYFDFIWSYSVFSHIPFKNTDSWLKELNRITKKNGYLILTWHGNTMSTGFLNNNHEHRNDYENNQYTETTYNPTHISDSLNKIQDSYINIYYKNEKIVELVSKYFKFIYITENGTNPLELVMDNTDDSIVQYLKDNKIGTMQEFVILQKI